MRRDGADATYPAVGTNRAKHRMSTKDTKNPCVGICRFDRDGACLGCHCTKAEVKGWKRLSDAAKAAINQRVRAQGGAVKAGTKRRRKLDRKIEKLEARLGALRAEREALSDAPRNGAS